MSLGAGIRQSVLAYSVSVSLTRLEVKKYKQSSPAMVAMMMTKPTILMVMTGVGRLAS